MEGAAHAPRLHQVPPLPERVADVFRGGALRPHGDRKLGGRHHLRLHAADIGDCLHQVPVKLDVEQVVAREPPRAHLIPGEGGHSRMVTERMFRGLEVLAGTALFLGLVGREALGDDEVDEHHPEAAREVVEEHGDEERPDDAEGERERYTDALHEDQGKDRHEREGGDGEVERHRAEEKTLLALDEEVAALAARVDVEKAAEDAPAAAVGAAQCEAAEYDARSRDGEVASWATRSGCLRPTAHASSLSDSRDSRWRIPMTNLSRRSPS